jgi:hypothetical protein
MDAFEKKALNRALYRRCKATFGHVKVRHSGESQVRRMRIDIVSGKQKPSIVQSGEYYAVCCPFCNDTRYRCYINHRYGTDDELGRAQTYLAYCHNAGCPLSMRSPEAYKQLADMLMGHRLIDLRKVKIEEGNTVDIDNIRMNWPGTVVRIDTLPNEHPANVYLISRGFNPRTIGRFYKVHYCVEGNKICKDRLIVPIYHNQKMVGWQARAIFDCDWKQSLFPKYYTAPGTPRREILYNFDNAIKYNTGIIVEGVTDVWKVGPQAVCTFGANITLEQQRLFQRGFKDNNGLLFYDPDVREKLKEKTDLLIDSMRKKLNSGFCAVYLPDGQDPGSCTRQFLRKYISNNSAMQGVIVDWNRRADNASAD